MVHALVLCLNSMIHLTQKAAEKVREHQQEDDLGDTGLRVGVRGGGCAGFSYELSFVEDITERDHHLESEGIKIYVDFMSAVYLEGTHIDYVEGLHGAGFKFNNPVATSSCGCGSSFAA